MNGNSIIKQLFIFFLCFGINECKAAATSQPYLQRDVFLANSTDFGNKTANLIELENLVPYLNQIIPGGTFAVPKFFGIKNSDIIAYLQNQTFQNMSAWDYIRTTWNSFEEAQRPDPSNKLNETGVKILADIRTALESINFDINQIISEKNDPERFASLQTFIKNAAQKNELLMVRSTGREDSKELSNAGGNASVASIYPTEASISKAIAEVLSSYFSEKSISQRMLGNDQRLFEEPFMAVLLQVMVGEIVGESTEIPVSGVMFNPEAEGETPGVVSIESTFGHNEGVVNGLVPVDTYYIGPTRVIHPVISVKYKRRAALSGKEGLYFVPNNKTEMYRSSLNRTYALQLANAARIIGEYYADSVDLEFVVMDNVIYFVQARPLEAKKFNASFLSEIFITSSLSPKITVMPIGIGNGSVRIISGKNYDAVQIIRHANQLVIAENIRQALETFLYKTLDKNAIKAIIIQEAAPANSHEATQFRRLGLPVLYAQDISKIIAWQKILAPSERNGEELLTETSSPLFEYDFDPNVVTLPQSSSSSDNFASTSSSSPVWPAVTLKETDKESFEALLIDPQRGLIMPFFPNEAFVRPETAVESGWYSHPIAKKVSIIPNLFPNISPAALDLIFEKLPPKEFNPTESTSDLIAYIKNGTIEEANQAMQTLLHRTLASIRRNQRLQSELSEKSKETNKQLISDMLRTFKALTISAYELYITLLNNPTRLQRLYPAIFIEALIRQIPEPARLVDDYSFGSLLKAEELEQEFVEELNLTGKPIRAHIVQYAKIGIEGLTSAVTQHWKSFLQNLADIPNQQLQNDFAKLMLNLKRLEIVAPWLNTSFENTYNQIAENDPEAIAMHLSNEYHQVAEILDYLQGLQQFFNSFDVATFDEPATFVKQWQSFQNELQKIISPKFIENMASSNNLVQIAALQIMHKSVESLDLSIKALTGSRNYSNIKQKIIRFKDMVSAYFALLVAWTADPYVRASILPMLDPEKFGSVEDYLAKIQQALDATSDNPEELDSTPNFSVAAATIGSKASWEYAVPEKITLEDIFSLIHQNLLIVQGLFANKTALAHMVLPEIPQYLIDSAKHLRFQVKKQTGLTLTQANLIGTSFADNVLTLFYNLPQRHHSSTFRIQYDIRTHTTSLTINFLGDARYRWQILGDTGSVLAKLFNITVLKPSEVDHSRGILSFTWQIQTKEQADAAITYLQLMAEYATDIILQNNLLKSLASKYPSISFETLLSSILTAVPEKNALLLYVPSILLTPEGTEVAPTNLPKVQISARRLLLKYFTKVKGTAQPAILEALANAPFYKNTLNINTLNGLIRNILHEIDQKNNYDLLINIPGMIQLATLLPEDINKDLTRMFFLLNAHFKKLDVEVQKKIINDLDILFSDDAFLEKNINRLYKSKSSILEFFETVGKDYFTKYRISWDDTDHAVFTMAKQMLVKFAEYSQDE